LAEHLSGFGFGVRVVTFADAEDFADLPTVDRRG
jgi:hypothetical protein